MSALHAGPEAAAVLGLFGLLVGSFANVVIYRVPAGRSLVKPPSACPACAQPVRKRDNVPVLGWAWLRGRCRDCGAPISLRYPLVELLVGVIFALIGARFGLTWTGVGEAFMAGGLVPLAFIDFDHKLLPRKVVYATLGCVGLVFLAASLAGGDWHHLWVAALCALVPWALFFVINYANPKALGFGDVRLALLIGFGLGWLGAEYALLGFLISSLLGAIVGMALMSMGRASRKTAVPFGTFLASGAVLAALAGAPVVSWYSAMLH